MSRLRITLIAILALAFAALAADGVRYPNELDGFGLWRAGSWQQLTPLQSTLSDVRRILGDPVEVTDLDELGQRYPGDDKAGAPVFTYYGGEEWKILIYFVRSDYFARQEYPSELHDRVLSIDFVPQGRMSLEGVAASSPFTKRPVSAACAAWDEYSDGTGLVYSIYTGKPAYGNEGPGDLNRISYGPSNREHLLHRRK